VIASLIHQGSQRAGKPLVAINCAALPEQLLESELFGHEKGAFTGAIATKIGRIEQAEAGTLFLDEIAEMSPLVQAKFLRVLEEREFQRVGGTRTLKADVRIVAATNRDLAASIARQAFREDQFYRLNVFQIHIAPLRQRPEDILPLAETFLEELGRTMGRPAAGISGDAREWLLAYPWPGNVRELRNAIERAILLCDGGLITPDHLVGPMVRPERAPAGNPVGPTGRSVSESVDLGMMERSLIERALSQSKGNKSKAPRLLGLTRAQLYSRLDKHGIRWPPRLRTDAPEADSLCSQQGPWRMKSTSSARPEELCPGPLASQVWQKLRLFRWLDRSNRRQVDYNRFLTTSHLNALERLFLAGVDLLMRDERRNIDEVAGTGLGQKLEPFTLAPSRPPLPDIDDAFELSMMMSPVLARGWMVTVPAQSQK